MCRILILSKERPIQEEAKVIGFFDIDFENNDVSVSKDFGLSVNVVNKVISDTNLEVNQLIDIIKDQAKLRKHYQAEICAISNNKILLYKKPVSQISHAADLPFPPKENMDRVGSHNDFNQESFSESARALAYKASNLYEAVTGETINESTKVLDWGCGCGKIYRYLKNTGCQYTGADIDYKNLSWCRENLPEAELIQLAPNDASDLKGRQFDLVFSFSVMTHLIERDQIFWLKELCKVTSGFLVLSIHGTNHTAAVNKGMLDTLVEEGKIGGSVNQDIGDVDDQGSYVDVANSYGNILRGWSKFVDVLAIIPGALAHDWVVAKPKSRMSL